ncbi:thiamine precursor transporter HmpT [Clostridium saccharobutylicum]|uniref:ECF transporter S component n=1 Tax=Clostridium saccharobutylicum TaxID=169679 RepID=UPI000983AA10|nr:ECF transporter S component [Clostridium saccharobutylicum]AQS11868.1 thiamine precursor transporter HmpT [Clostridium saccharobutylicum]MBC2435568.1 ECF transporter S component [Clostridium saccharobutylicum]NSB86971.1 putative membrane protein [Clostridium saccharobutylicum]NYC30124.1 putative membrane protein [Clostridium saccharobutylicum]OOM18789.1 thiamine precursor transporter HmpT [Clostridium saccharobutylicum]
METNKKSGAKEIVLMGLMTALICIAGSIIKIPSVGGFVHLGDCMVFLSVVILGKKKGIVASAFGMFFVDILGGYYLWAPFTLLIKGAMAYITGTILEIMSEHKSNMKYVISFVVSGIFMVLAYFGAGIIMAAFLTEKTGLMQGMIYSAKDIIGNIVQVSTGIIIALPLSNILLKAKKAIA